MTREIKFRAWNTQENRMLFRRLFEMNWYTTEKNDENGSHCWGAISGGQSRFLEVMQFTGLHDKNGKEIYEGDIVKNERGVTVKVEWGQSHARTEGWCLDISFKWEIIGNIYENPELLK